MKRLRNQIFAQLLLTISALISTGCNSENSEESHALLVAAAANLSRASGPLGTAFERSSGATITFSFGSSRQLEQQIRQGAPFDVYIPAARLFSQSLERDGFVEGQAKHFAVGRLTAWSRLFEVESLEELREERIRRVAVANPRFAPYGLAAQEALQASGLWQALQPKLVYGESVLHTFQMAETGNAEVALVALALVQDAGHPYLLIDQSLHRPIEQTAVVLKGSENKPVAKAFVEFLLTSEARQLLENHGYGLPE